MFLEFSPEITTPARLWAGLGFRNLKKGLEGVEGEAWGWRAGIVFLEFSRPESSKSPPRASLGWFRAPKPENGLGKGRLAGGVRERCFRSFHSRSRV